MPTSHDLRFRGRGTRVALYPQPPELSAIGEPETVWLSRAPGTVGPGPSDDRVYVVDPLRPKRPYAFPDLPPFRGAEHAPVRPGPDGHFDHLDPGSRAFRAVHMYGVIRRVLDIWEGYFGHRIRWHFQDHFARLELVPSLEWDNAHSGYGFLEAGRGRSDDGASHHYALNFDVLAHELGHAIVYSQLGLPGPGGPTAEYLALQESFADILSLVSVLHFDSVVDRLLADTGGNLYVLNELNRIGEVSDADQIRVASNDLRMSDVVDGYGRDAEACDEHRLGQPVTGALFDVLVDVFLEELRDRQVVDGALLEHVRQGPGVGADYLRYGAAFERARAIAGDAFREALGAARDYLGEALAIAWTSLGASVTSFSEVRAAMIRADEILTGGRHAPDIAECFEWREIGADETWPSTAVLDRCRRAGGTARTGPGRLGRLTRRRVRPLRTAR